MKLINIDLYARVKAYAFAMLFKVAKADFAAAKPENQRTAKIFLQYISDSLPQDLAIDGSLVEVELQIADLARRVKNFDQRRLDFEMTFDETR